MPQSPIAARLAEIHGRFKDFGAGKVADYIPELAKANPDWFGICLATRDGHVYEVGDTFQPFTIQSISKPLTYGLALDDREREMILKKIGVEPSGEAFNAISLIPDTGAPMNPMINAGAIASCGLVCGSTAGEKIGRILDVFSRYAGRELDVDEAVYQSESQTGHRNRAIGWMLRNFGILEEDPAEALETYFRQCSIRVTCRDLALMGATLSNHGENPVTGLRAVRHRHVKNVLSVMSTCGMYDFSGEWMYEIGLPAKSGVGGGILAVFPGQFGLAVFSPPLDAQGNSARGIAVCRALSRSFQLHLMNTSTPPVSSVRQAFDRQSTSSRRRRSRDESGLLLERGRRIRGFHLQGVLAFGMIEPVIRQIVEQAVDTDYFIVNLKSVIDMDGVACELLRGTQRTLEAEQKQLVFSQVGAMRDALLEVGIGADSIFPDDDFALEYCEEALLIRLCVKDTSEAFLGLGDCALFASLDPDEIEYLDALLPTRTYKLGDTLIERGQDADEILILCKGTATVVVPGQAGRRRLDVFSAGMTLGDFAFIDRSKRTADIVAERDAVCRILARTDFTAIGMARPALKIKLLENLAGGLGVVLRRLTRELEALI